MNKTNDMSLKKDIELAFSLVGIIQWDNDMDLDTTEAVSEIMNSIIAEFSWNDAATTEPKQTGYYLCRLAENMGYDSIGTRWKIRYWYAERKEWYGHETVEAWFDISKLFENE